MKPGASNTDWIVQAFGGERQAEGVDAGGRLFRRGDEPDCLYLVLSGEARACCPGPKGTELVMQCSHAGELFGEAGLVAPRHACDGICPVDSRVLRFPLDQVRARIARKGEFALRFAELLASVLARQHARYECLRLTAAERVLHYLHYQRNGSPKASLALDISMAEWAAKLCLDPATLSRTLARMEKQGLIAREPRGRTIRIVGGAPVRPS